MQDFKVQPSSALVLTAQPHLSPRAKPARFFKLRSSLAALAAAGAMSLPSAAHACCNDFWSCGAAFVTGGLSCAIQAAQEESRRILNEARRALDNARRAYDEAVNGTQNKVAETRNKAQQDSRDSLGAMDTARNSVQVRLANPVRTVVAPRVIVAATPGALPSGLPAGVRVTAAPAPAPATAPQSVSPSAAVPMPTPFGGSVSLPPPPSPEEVRRALEDAMRTIDSLRQRGRDQDLPQVSQAIARMNDSIGRSLGNVHGVVRQSVFTPLEEILRILGATDPTGLTNLIAAAVTGLDAATTALDTEVFRAMQSLDDVIVGALGEVEGEVSELVASADLARAIEAKVNALSEQPTQAQVNELRGLLPSDPARRLTAANIRVMSGVTLSPALRVSIAMPKAAPAANSMKLAMGPLSNQLKDPMLRNRLQPPAEKMAFKSRLDQYLGNEFAGLSGAPRAAKRQQLIDESRRRFASNPQQAQEMEQLISQAAGPVLVAPAILASPAVLTAPAGATKPPLNLPPQNTPMVIPVPQRPMAFPQK
ncbi:MAG: hypothetical protein EAZ37_11315 [Burkholderiales bacterium]|nr:MAG: hypothetical protein EAZ37_11315 [Burkholderiales bacterium]